MDIKGAFNAIRDMVYNRAGADDPKADDKLDHATKASEEMKRIMKPYNKMRLIAPTNVIDAAVDVNAAMLATLRATTEPFAQPITRKAAGDAIEKFVNVFRAEIGKDMYTASKAQRAGDQLPREPQAAGARLHGRVEGRDEGGGF